MNGSLFMHKTHPKLVLFSMLRRPRKEMAWCPSQFCTAWIISVKADMISFIWDVLRTRPRNTVQRSTAERRYNAVQYNMVLRTSLGKNIYRSFDPRNTSHTLPWIWNFGSKSSYSIGKVVIKCVCNGFRISNWFFFLKVNLSHILEFLFLFVTCFMITRVFLTVFLCSIICSW